MFYYSSFLPIVNYSPSEIIFIFPPKFTCDAGLQVTNSLSIFFFFMKSKALFCLYLKTFVIKV